jgi:hypothetical protein
MEGIKEPAGNWITFVLGSQLGPNDGTEEDTYVAVLERAPQKNEEVMIVFTKVVQCQQMVYPSVHGPRVGKGHTARMAAYNELQHSPVGGNLQPQTKVQNGHNLSRPSDELSLLVLQVLLVTGEVRTKPKFAATDLDASKILWQQRGQYREIRQLDLMVTHRTCQQWG